MPHAAVACDWGCQIKRGWQKVIVEPITRGWKDQFEDPSRDFFDDAGNKLSEVEKIEKIKELENFIKFFKLDSKDTQDQILDKLLPKLNGINMVRYIEQLKVAKASIGRNSSMENPLGDFSNSELGSQINHAVKIAMHSRRGDSGEQIKPLAQQVLDQYSKPQISSMIPVDNRGTLSPIFISNKSEQDSVESSAKVSSNQAHALTGALNDMNDIIFGRQETSGNIESLRSSIEPNRLFGHSTNLQLRLGGSVSSGVQEVNGVVFVVLPLSWATGFTSNQNSKNAISGTSNKTIFFTAGVELGVGLKLKVPSPKLKDKEGNDVIPDDIEPGKTTLTSELNVNFECKLPVVISQTPECMIHSFFWNVGNLGVEVKIADAKAALRAVKSMKAVVGYASVFGIPALVEAVTLINNVIDDATSLLDSFERSEQSNTAGEIFKKETPNFAFAVAMIVNLIKGDIGTKRDNIRLKAKLLTKFTPLQLVWLNQDLKGKIFKSGWNSGSDSSIDLINIRLLLQNHIDFDLITQENGAYELYLRLRYAFTQSATLAWPMTAVGRDYVDSLGKYQDSPFLISN